MIRKNIKIVMDRETDREVDIFDIKKDIIQTLMEAGYNRSKIYIDDITPNYYHPGKSGRIFLNKEKNNVVGYFVKFTQIL